MILSYMNLYFVLQSLNHVVLVAVVLAFVLTLITGQFLLCLVCSTYYAWFAVLIMLGLQYLLCLVCGTVLHTTSSPGPLRNGTRRLFKSRLV